MESPTPSTSSGRREGLGRLRVKLCRYRKFVQRHWWVLALTTGVGLAYQGWVVARKPPQFTSSAQLAVPEEYTTPTSF